MQFFDHNATTPLHPEAKKAWLERLWSGGVVRSELSGPQGAIAEYNTPGAKGT